MNTEIPNRYGWQREEIAEDEVMEIWEKKMRQKRVAGLVIDQLQQTEGYTIPSSEEVANS